MGMTAGYQVERLIGEWQPRLIPRHDDHHTTRVQELGGQRRVWRPRLRRDHGGREFLSAHEHLTATGIDVARGRNAR